MSRPLVIVGDTLLDVDIDGTARRLCPEAPVPVLDESHRSERPGGAGLAAILARRAAVERVVLITALGTDAAADRLRELLAPQVTVLALPLVGDTVCKTRARADGQSIVRIDSGDGHAAALPLTDEIRWALRNSSAVLVADYGRGVVANPELRELLADAATRVPVVWDPHPRGERPVPGVRLVTPNHSEAAGLAPDHETDGARARLLAMRWGADAVAVTVGPDGAVCYDRGTDTTLTTPVPYSLRVAPGADTCGAGDRFAAAAAAALGRGERIPEAVHEAVCAAAAFVGDGGAPAAAEPPADDRRDDSGDDPFALAERVRRSGGRLVATGGCFDLLHPGHISLLRQARSLGDALIVCLNSDESIRGRKGADRPVVPAHDRARVLLELSSVDAVVVFDEPTPTGLLERLRPDVWVKGDDYAGSDLPEADTVHRHGGEIVLVPVLPGYSTTRLVAAARATA
ncbi:PfkB family carbohydrate kinase [Nocardia wallacei]|uniref:PfkB family carbohydrate kinase n=1 Tax=Nocardia wallacei TaxID=480035 RepID=UPI00245643A6|nr:PfkB family carbohydrate kinase [Nocardia wallacei]